MSTAPHRVLADRLALALLGVTVLVLGAVFVTAPVPVLVRFVPDDAFYYLEIARRISLGEGSTFDGVQPTNGYHPLWLAALVPLGPLFELDRTLGARVVLVGCLALLTASLLTVRSVVRLARGDGAVALVLATCTVGAGFVYGMETALACALLMAVAHRLATDGLPAGPRTGAIVGLLAAALVLTRLDAVAYVAALDLLWIGHAVRARRRAVWAGLAVGVALQVALIGGYLTWNLVGFGHLLPVSALVKAERSGAFNLRWMRRMLPWLAVIGLIPSAALLALVRAGPGLAAMRLLAVGSGLHVAGFVVGGGPESYSWYFALPVLCGAASTAVLVRRTRHRPTRQALTATLVVTAGVLLVTGVRSTLRTTGFTDRAERALWLAANAPLEARFAEGDCGILAWFSGRSFLNLDGLTGSFDYQEALEAERLAPWLTAAGLNAVVLPTADPPNRGADGRPRSFLKVRRARRSDRGGAWVVLGPWEPPVRDHRFTVWRVLAIEPARVR